MVDSGLDLTQKLDRRRTLCFPSKLPLLAPKFKLSSLRKRPFKGPKGQKKVFFTVVYSLAKGSGVRFLKAPSSASQG